MPSGLTYKICSGEELTLRDFALKCVTQLGAGYRASRQGEKELPRDKAPVQVVSPYHKEKIESLKKELDKWIKLRDNLEEAQKLYEEQYSANMKYNAECNEEREQRKQYYSIMLKKVEEWDVPEEYNSLKKLMHKQLVDSIKWDCSPCTPYKEERVPIEEWVEVQIKLVTRDIDFHIEALQEEKARVSEDNKYLEGLYKALDKVEPLT